MVNKQNIKYGAASLVAALMVAVPFVTDREGESLQAYQDVVGVWTICHGETLGVKPGDVKSRAECRELTKSRVGQFMNEVALKHRVILSPATLAAHTSFAYNIGINGYSRSRTLQLTNAGDISGGCRAMMGWYRAGGKDCRIRANNCYGVVKRRMDEVNLCLSGV